MRPFPLIMAWRETRKAWRHFLYFFICIALGVGALVSIALFGANVARSVTQEARGLMAGDLEVRLSHPLSRSGQAVLDSLAARDIASTHVSELVAMAAGTGEGPRPTQIIELKAVEAGYPFYGSLRVEPAEPLEALLAPRDGRFGAVVQQALLVKMQVELGDEIAIGEARFRLTGLLKKEPDRVANLFSLGPRVLISQQGLAAAGLVKPGSRVRERYLLRVPAAAPLDPLLGELRGRLANESVRVLSFEDAQPQLRRFLDQLTRYLGLIGLIALFVGGVGVASTVQAFIREKLPTIAILKTLGAESATVVRTYAVQALALGLIGSALGALLGLALQQALPRLLTGLLPLEQLDLSLAPAPVPILKGVAMGLLTTLLFSLWPLLGIRRVRPALIFRRDIEPVVSRTPGPGEVRGPRRALVSLRAFLGGPRPPHGKPAERDPGRAVAALGIGLGLALLAIWQAGSYQTGLIFMGALLLAVAVLRVAAVLLVRVIALVPTPGSVAVRHALRNLYRPGSHAPGILLAVGIGVMVIVAASLLERSLIAQIGQSRPLDSPTFFFIDVQPDQHDELGRLLRTHVPAGDVTLTPLVRSRLFAVNGQRVERDRETGQDGRERETSWYFTREYVLTSLPALPKDNVIVRGQWWDPTAAGSGRRPGVSVEEEAARHLGLTLGSVVEFDIQGTTVTTEVQSLRKVDWGNLSTNFYMILEPGALDGAPFTYVATARVPPEQELAVQRAVVTAFPNVTAINIGDVLDNVTRILERLALAIRAIAVFCILAGAIVMAAALAATRYQRLYESGVLKAVGATRGLIARAFATEYAVLGLVAGFLGVLLASLLSWIVLEQVLELTWRLQPGVLVGGVVLTVLLTVTVGFLSTSGIVRQRPLQVLRGE